MIHEFNEQKTLAIERGIGSKPLGSQRCRVYNDLYVCNTALERNASLFMDIAGRVGPRILGQDGESVGGALV